MSSPDVALNDSDQVRWATEHLDAVLADRGVRIQVVVEGDESAPESFTLARPDGPDGPVVIAAADPRGAMYGLLEIADVVSLADDPVARLRDLRPSVQTPATPVRGIMRTFVSDVEDLPWFRDRDFWVEYLTELATDRVNRFQLCLGIQYNFPHNPVGENYFCFAYPFLVTVPGYDVHADGVSAGERAANLETLRFISDEANRRGITFVLGLWNHAYDEARAEGSDPVYPVRGLTPATHAPYCRAALAELLRACPSIGGLTLRIHYEGGIPDPERETFWRTVLGGVAEAGRPVELDLHAKGVDAPMLAVATETGQPVTLSAKYLAEHWGLPYHQASIRDKEFSPPPGVEAVRAVTGGARSFTRYGYGDFLREDSSHRVMFRMWPGGQRVLLWGDPVLAAGYGRLSTIGGATGAELCEPLSYKGRKGTGTPGGRDVYADQPLRLGRRDWTKYRYTYRLWGRLLYDPDAAPDTWRRLLRADYGAAAEAVERALAPASRIIPLVTTVHGVGASISNYWPEMYVDMPIITGPHVDHYAGDSAAPPTFAGVSPFDPSLFYRVVEYADDVVAGHRDGRYSPLEVAGWLESLASEAERNLAVAGTRITDPADPVFRRTEVDVTAQAGLGRFFAGKLRAALAHAVYERTKNPEHLWEAVASYRVARQAYAAVAEVTTGVYRPDLTFGYRLSEHGHWADRLPAIDADLAALERLAGDAAGGETTALPEVPPGRRGVVEHTPESSFAPGRELSVVVRTDRDFAGRIVLCYRHLNQGERFLRTEIHDGLATIPAGYTDSPYALMYYFVVTDPGGDAWIEPGLEASLANQPYYVVRSAMTE